MPFIFIATNTVAPGRLQQEREQIPRLAALVQANEPQLLAFETFENEEGTEVTTVQVHRDAESMQVHLQVSGSDLAAAYAETHGRTIAIDVYGEPNQSVLELLNSQKEAGVPVRIRGRHLGGFSRSGT